MANTIVKNVATVSLVYDGVSTWQTVRLVLIVVFSAVLAYAVFRLCRLARSVMRHRRDQCVACGYLLVHSPKVIGCPECGEEKGPFATRSRIGIVVRISIVSLVAATGLLVSIWPKYLVQASPDVVIVALFLAGCKESLLVEEIEHRAYRGFSPWAVRLISRYAWHPNDFEFRITTPDEWVDGIPVLGLICLEEWPLDPLGGDFSVRMRCGSASESSGYVFTICGYPYGELADPRVEIPGIGCGVGEVECRVLIEWSSMNEGPEAIFEETIMISQPNCVGPSTLAVRWEEDCESILIGAVLDRRSPTNIMFTLQDVSAIVAADVPCMMMAYDVRMMIDDHVIGLGKLRYFRHQSNMVNWARLAMPIELTSEDYKVTGDDLASPSRLRVMLSPSESIAMRSGKRCHYIDCVYEIPVVIRNQVNE